MNVGRSTLWRMPKGWTAKRLRTVVGAPENLRRAGRLLYLSHRYDGNDDDEDDNVVVVVDDDDVDDDGDGGDGRRRRRQ